MENNIKESPRIKSLKEGLRTVALMLVSYLLTEGVVDFLIQYIFGNTIDLSIKMQLSLFFTIVLKSLDNYLHEKGKATGNKSLSKGLTRF